MRITPEYTQLNNQLHIDNEHYGVSGHLYAEQVREIADAIPTTDILDYGCGKQTLNQSLPIYSIRGYDPAMPGCQEEPKPADLVTCTDVMEHIEPDCLDAVLDHIQGLTRKVALISVCTKPALKFLSDGRNAHLIQKGRQWWERKMGEKFEITAVAEYTNTIVFILEGKE